MNQLVDDLKINSPWLFPWRAQVTLSPGANMGQKATSQFCSFLVGCEWIGLGEMCECIFSIICTSYSYYTACTYYILGVAKTLGFPWIYRRWACQVSGLRMGAAQCQGYLGAVGKVVFLFEILILKAWHMDFIYNWFNHEVWRSWHPVNLEGLCHRGMWATQARWPCNHTPQKSKQRTWNIDCR